MRIGLLLLGVFLGGATVGIRSELEQMELTNKLTSARVDADIASEARDRLLSGGRFILRDIPGAPGAREWHFAPAAKQSKAVRQRLCMPEPRQ